MRALELVGEQIELESAMQTPWRTKLKNLSNARALELKGEQIERKNAMQTA